MSRFPWTRYGYPRGEALQFDADGYPYDPADMGHVYQPNAVDLPKMLAADCLVLLGEPGLGKSDTMTLAVEHARASLAPEELLSVNLGFHPDLDDELFRSPQFLGWQQHGRPLHLFIDSLDEGPSNFANRLAGKLKQGDAGRLHLRIACRTGAFPGLLETLIREKWGDKKAKYYELMPLCRSDVEAMVGAGASDFLDLVQRRGVTPLAIRPITLFFLIDAFKTQATLPDSRWELYERGCECLCEESSDTRIAAEQRGVLNPSQRMRVAERIAAVCTLGERQLIQRESDRGMLREGTVRWAELHDDDDVPGSLPITDSALRETLQHTSLFSSRGDKYLGFAHASYASFLTARFLRTRGLGVVDLVQRCADPTGPTLLPSMIRDIAGWLSGSDAATRRWLLEHDPRALLLADLPQTPQEERAELTQTILEQIDSQRLYFFDSHPLFRYLAHDGLAEQLQPWITGRERHFVARRTAIQIADAGGCTSLIGILVDIALATDESPGVRSHAFIAVLRIGTPSDLERLLPLLLSPDTNAPDQYTRAHLVRLLWPSLPPPEKLVELLEAAVAQRASAIYYRIEHRLVPAADAAHVIRMLDWLRGRKRGHEGLAAQLVLRALQLLDDPKVLQSFAQYVHFCMSRQDEPDWSRSELYMRTIADLTTRQRLLAEVVNVATTELRYRWLRSHQLVGPDDAAWLIERHLTARDDIVRERWARLIADAEELTPGGAAEAALAAALEQSASLRDAMWAPVELDSPRAQALRREHQARIWEEEAKAPTPDETGADVKPGAVLKDLVESIDAATISTIDEVLHELWYAFGEPPGRRVEDLTLTEAWRALPETSRMRVVSLGQEFLTDCRVPSPDGHRFHRHYRSRTHYCLLRLMQVLHPDWLKAQPAELWHEWAAVVVFNLEVSDEAAHVTLLKLAHALAREQLEQEFNTLIDCATTGAELAVAVKWTLAVLGDATAAFLAPKLSVDTFPPAPFGELLLILKRSNDVPLDPLLARLLEADLSHPDARARAVAAARALFLTEPDFAWPRLAPFFAADLKLGEEIMYLVLKELWHVQPEMWSGKDETQLARVYHWLEQHFPERDDPGPEGTGEQRQRYRLGELRDTLRRNLQDRGTPTSLAELTRLREELPLDRSLPYALSLARDRVAADTWRALPPSEVIHLRPVRQHTTPSFERALLRLTAEGLHRFAADLDPDLPNELPHVLVPKNELAHALHKCFSDRGMLHAAIERLCQHFPDLRDGPDALL